MQSQSSSNLRFIGHGVAVGLSVALHLWIIQLRLPIPSMPETPQDKAPLLTIPQRAVQVRPRPPEQSLDVTPPSPTHRSPSPEPQPTPEAQASTPPVNTSVAIDPDVRSQEPETPPKPPQTQSKLLEDDPSPEDQPVDKPDSSPATAPSLPPDDSLAVKWDGLISSIQEVESEFGQAQSLQDIFLLFGRDNQYDLFFDSSDQPRIQILSYQLFTKMTPQQVWDKKILPTLQKQDSIEITEDQMFAEGKVYRVAQGEFVRYLNVVPLHQPQEVVLLEMAEAPSRGN
ncbi:hypothetical protein [Acaryochloris marina]|uniref:hypothetical protein n=1 Tax=Acaryochloris marina TaxID=155978 RepID=UPI0021C2E818|nr:hypothetical protein [Acaryochloris marina]BDM83419.1 hypothetical protein AM10699_62800 [Acaryochloris marina MBIC10699]